MFINVKIEGVTPLLMHKFNEESLNKNGVKVNSNKNQTPREIAEKTAYKDENDELYVPFTWVFGALINAGKYFKMNKNKVTTVKSSIVPAGISLTEEKFFLNTKHFEVDSRSVVIPSTQGRVMQYRARLDTWSIKFCLMVDETIFDINTVRELVDTAGTKIGIGAYRPDRKGLFGKFKVTEWNVTKNI